MTLIYFLGYFSALICQMKKSVFIHFKKSAIPQNTYRMADAGLGIAHVSGKINGADHAMPLLEHQHRFQIILAGCLQFHRCSWVASFEMFRNSPAKKHDCQNQNNQVRYSGGEEYAMRTQTADLRQKNGQGNEQDDLRIKTKTLALDAFPRDCIRVMTIRTKPSTI